VFSGGRVDFREASGSVPAGLLPAQGEALPAELVLPAHWCSNDT
jgi:hypothetical protein